MEYSIVDIGSNENYVTQAAIILHQVFLKLDIHTWPTIASAIKEVNECIENRNICIGILIDNKMVGWIGLRPMYEKTWELHPLVVSNEYQNKGVGKILMNEIEKMAKGKGLIGIVLGTDDENDKTSLSKVDINNKNICSEIANIKNLNHHPFEFYQKCGYFIIGIIPNANGKNKPDIWMWKNIL
jgi:aminoglycoside 6'-N-acetyltransferase I